MKTVSDISTRPLAQASVKSVGRVKILDHSPVWRVQFLSPRNYLKIKIKHDFTLYFGKKIPKHKLTISTLQSFVFRRQGTYYIRLNNIIWLPSSDNYIKHLLVQSNTAGHHRAIGDQVDIPLLRGTDTFAYKLQEFHEGLSIKNLLRI